MNEKNPIREQMHSMGRRARVAAREMARADSQQKNQALSSVARSLREQAQAILAANALDVKRAKESGYDAAFIDRLTMTNKTVELMALGLEQIISLSDPIGHIGEYRKQASGIMVAQMRVPLGVIGIIYESRPNVTIDAAALCLKSGNAVILRGGSEAIESNTFLAKLIQGGLLEAKFPLIQFKSSVPPIELRWVR